MNEQIKEKKHLTDIEILGKPTISIHCDLASGEGEMIGFGEDIVDALYDLDKKLKKAHEDTNAIVFTVKNLTIKVI